MPRGKKKCYRLATPPDEIVRPIVEQYVAAGYNNTKIVQLLRSHYDCKTYNLSLSNLKKKRMDWGIKSARGQALSLSDIGPAIESIRQRFPKQGSHDMRVTLLHECGLAVPRTKILNYMNEHHRSEVLARARGRLKRSHFWTAGVNDVWAMDQHDKWRKFELFLHVCVEPFSGYVLWLKVWWTNRNPRLVCGWYCDVLQHLGGMPLITQSDLGKENNGVANAQTLLRHLHDPALAKTLQHSFRRSHGNIKPEIFWHQLRERWTPGFEGLMDQGLHNGWYRPEDGLERLLFFFLFIPYLQVELDGFRKRFNDTLPQRNKHKILPHGRPGDIFHNPTTFDSVDFRVQVHPPYLQEVRLQYAPPDHPVFDLVPPTFFQRATALIILMGDPILTYANIWNTYLWMLQRLRAQDDRIIQDVILSLPAVVPPEKELCVAPGDEIEVLKYPAYRAGQNIVGESSAHARPSSQQWEIDETNEYYEFDFTESENESDVDGDNFA